MASEVDRQLPAHDALAAATLLAQRAATDAMEEREATRLAARRDSGDPACAAIFTVRCSWPA
jgi:hypothetical protein